MGKGKRGGGKERECAMTDSEDSSKEPQEFFWWNRRWRVTEALNISKEALEKLKEDGEGDVDFLFRTCTLCTLSTCADSHPESSLMFYTYDPSEITFIFNTPSKADLKYQNIVKNKNVSVLLHNFEGASATQSLLHSKQALAVTVYGEAKICSKKEEEAYLISTGKHATYAKAYQGSHTVMFKLQVSSLLHVNVKGEVLRLEEIKESSSGSS